MDLIFYFINFIFFYFGAIMGSFLNVIEQELEKSILDENEKKSFWERINRRSKCPHCGHQLKYWELFPIFSYIFLRGKCYICHKKISIRYFLIELGSGILFLLIFNKIFQGNFDLNFFLNFFSYTLIFSGLILIFLFDAKNKIIPDEIYIPTLIISLIYLILSGNLNLTIFITSIVAALPFFLLWYLSKGKWIGFADWEMVFLLSLFLKFGTQVYSFLTLSFWLGALYYLPIYFLKKEYTGKTEIPFGPFIILSFIIVFFFDFNVINFINLIF